jgi:hypothetical protein
MTRNRHTIWIVAALVAAICLSGTAASASASTLLSGYGGPGVGNQAILGSVLLGGPSGGGSAGGGGGSVAASSQAISAPNAASGESASSAGAAGKSSSRTRAVESRRGRRAGASTRPGAANTSGSTGRTYYVRARDVSQPPLGFSGTRLGLLILGIVVLVLTGAVMRRLLAVGPTKARAAQGVPDITRLTPE